MKKKLKCIMLIDDNKADNYYHQIILEDMDIVEKIEVAIDGVEALKMLETRDNCQPEVIFLDINMPKINGWEFLDAYREFMKEKTGPLPLTVILTTSQNPEDEKKAKKYPEVVCYRTKPLTEEMMNEILKNFFPDHVQT